MSNAQNQHYVPKFILRQFLVNQNKEQVSVYDKHLDKGFVTSIKNVMAERRFNDFAFEDWIVSFEPIASGIENLILPAYRRIVETRRLDGSPQEKADLGFLMAFQFLRTKAARDRYQSLEAMIKTKIEAMGHRMEDIEGWEPQTEDILKREELLGMSETIAQFAYIIAQKEFRLAEPLPGRSFYLGDNPVCLNNARDFGPYGNLGLAVKGIEIYLPLSSDLMLCAWCPSIVNEIRATVISEKRKTEMEALGLHMSGKISAADMKSLIDPWRSSLKSIEELTQALKIGAPMSSSLENMDFYNSMQTANAFRYVVCQQSDFGLAKRHNKEFPNLRKGRQFSFA